MPNRAPVILLVGHGSVSGQKAVINISNYNVILPNKIGDKLCLTAHNMIVQDLIAANNSQELFCKLQKLETLPSTTSVIRTNKQPILIQSNTDVANHTTRRELAQWLQKVEMNAFDSNKAWDLLEHRISPAFDIFSTDKAHIPIKFNKAYQEFPLMYEALIDGRETSTLAVSINVEKIKFQINSMSNTENQQHMYVTLADDQVIYMTPYVNNKSTLLLSRVLEALPLIHIMVKKEILFNSQEDIKVSCICLQDYMNTEPFIQIHRGSTCLYDFTLPDDCNLVLGACRDIDSSF